MRLTTTQLLVIGACGLLFLEAALILPAVPGSGGGASLPNGPAHTGLSPFVAQGGSAAESCSDVDTCTTGAITNVGAGDTLVVAVTEYTTSAGAPSSVEEVTSGGDNALTQLGVTPCVAGSGHGVTAIYGLADVAAQASVTFTVDYAADEFYTIHALDVEGAAASPFETAGAGVCSPAAGGTGTASVTTTANDDLVILGVEVRGTTTISATGGDSLVTQATTTGAELDSGAMLDEIDPATGAISLSATFTSGSWTALAVALKAPPLVSGVVSPSAAGIDAGQAIDLTTTAATGGTSPISYQWYAPTSTATCSSGTLITGATGLSYTTPSLPAGTDFYCVKATDSSTPTQEVVFSNVASVTVNSALSVTITPNLPSIDSGQAVQLTANPSGGTGADSYAWYSGGICSGTVLATTQTYTTPDLTATSVYCVAATDSSYEPVTATANDTVTVSATPLTVTITPSAPTIDSGQSVLLTANPSGGTGSDSFDWYLGSTCSGTALASSQAYTTTALTATSTYCVSVTDSAYLPATANATATVTVSAAPLTVTITPSAPSIDSGQTVTLTAEPSGGTGPYSFTWYVGQSCSGAVLARTQAYTTPTLSANATYCVVATDSAYSPVSANATVNVTVSAAPLAVSITPSAPSIDSGQVVQLTSHPTGGMGVDTYAWYSGSSCGGSALATTQTYTTAALATTTTFCVAVTDSAPVPATATATAEVTVSGLPLTVTISPGAPTIDSGQTVQLTAEPSGGTGADSYAWYSGAACSGTVLATTQAYTTSALTATATYCVVVTDSSSVPASASAQALVTVTSAAASSSSPPASVYPILGAAAAAVLAALLLALLVRRRKKVTFTENGLPEGTAWSVTLKGEGQRSTTPTITFRSSKGEHEYAVEAVAGYRRSPRSGMAKVGRHPVEVKVTFTKEAP